MDAAEKLNELDEQIEMLDSVALFPAALARTIEQADEIIADLRDDLEFLTRSEMRQYEQAVKALDAERN